jgi:tRNA dimethylallyltransferase
MDLKSKIILISGPTASGKSSLAIKLAKKVNGEIINADSMQVYKELSIITARPKKKNYNKISHYLYGFHSSKKIFSTGDWLKQSKKKIKEIRNKNKIPIFVGGTGLYFKALIEGMVKIPNIPIKFRNNIRALQKNLGQKKFYIKLIKLDPLLKNKINSNDMQRTIRAYEVKAFTKKSLNEWFKETKPSYKKKEFFKIYIDISRVELLKKINERSQQMLRDGAILEVKRFIGLKIKSHNSASKAIGISEIRDYLNKKNNLNQTIEKISIKTRQYAKRQRTWARSNMLDWQKIKPENINKFLKKI